MSRLLPAVALVPGFFGFDHRGESTYFADRFIAGLRCVLEARGVTGVPVVSVSTLGIASLHERQGELLRELRALESAKALGGPRTWHLVGHSTGGVDAAFLVRDAPLVRTGAQTGFASGGWGAQADLVERIGSVTTLAAPHFGTGLAAAPLARFVGSGHPSFAAVRDAARASVDVVHRGDLGSRIRFALSASPSATKMPFFLLQMLLMNELARDLHPDVVGALSARPARRSAEGRVFSIATIAPRPSDDHADRLFRDMWRWTHDGSLPSAIVIPRELDDPSRRLPTQRGLVLPRVGPGDNDGIATTARQVFGELIATVIGDHVDVLGRYRRVSMVDEKVIDPGLLTSGAAFGDDEFFALLVVIGHRIATVIQEGA